MDESEIFEKAKDESEIFEKVKEEICKQLPLNDPSKITRDSDYSNDLGADSLDIIELVMKFEYEFNMEINDRAASKIETVQDTIDYILEFQNKEILY